MQLSIAKLEITRDWAWNRGGHCERSTMITWPEEGETKRVATGLSCKQSSYVLELVEFLFLCCPYEPPAVANLPR